MFNVKFAFCTDCPQRAWEIKMKLVGSAGHSILPVRASRWNEENVKEKQEAIAAYGEVLFRHMNREQTHCAK